MNLAQMYTMPLCVLTVVFAVPDESIAIFVSHLAPFSYQVDDCYWLNISLYHV